MARRNIVPKRPIRTFIRAWREFRNLSQEELGQRLHPPASGQTISRYERAERLGYDKIDDGKNRDGNVRAADLNAIAAIAEVLAIEPRDLYRHPSDPSVDTLLRNQSIKVKEKAIELVRTLLS